MHFPLTTFIIFPFYLLTNWNLNIEPLASLIVGILTLASVFIAARIFLNKWGTVVSIAFFSLFYYFSSTSIQYSMEQLIGLLLIILLYKVILTIYLKQVNKLNLVILGVLIGLTELSGQIVTFSLAALFLFLAYFTKKIIPILAGILLSFIPFLLYLLFNNALFEFLNQNIFYYSIYIKLARAGSPLDSLPWNIILGFYLPLLMVIPILLKRKVMESRRKDTVNLLFIMSFVSIPSVVFSVYHPHHFLYILPVNSLLAGLSIDLIFSKKYENHKKIIVSPIVLFLFIFLSNILPWYLDRIGKYNEGLKPYNYKSKIINDVTPNTNMYYAVDWIKKNTKQDDNLLVAGDSLFYFRSDRIPANKLHTVLPWHYKPISESSEIIRRDRPDYWVIDSNFIKRLRSSSGWSSPEISQFIDEELKACYRKKVSFDEWEIWGKTCS